MIPSPAALAAEAAAAGTATVPVPQFVYSATLNPRTWTQIDRFEKRILQQHARNDDPDPVFFGPNTSLWFKALFNRDVGELGADAIVTSGRMLWGRFPKTDEAQHAIEWELRSIASRAGIEFTLRRPDPELWWGPVWSRAVKDPKATPQLLAAILRQVRLNQAQTPSWQGDLVEIWLNKFMLDYHDKDRAFDVSQEIRELLKGDPIPIGGRIRREDQEAAVDLGREAMRAQWDLVNQRLVQVHPDALAEEGLANCVARVAHFRNALNLCFQPKRILPGAETGPDWGPIVQELTRAANEFLATGAVGVIPPLRIIGARILQPPAPLGVTDPIKVVFSWAFCGFALKHLGDPRAEECRQTAEHLFREVPVTSRDDENIFLGLNRRAILPEPFGKPAEIRDEAAQGFWSEALSMFQSLTDPLEKMEALAWLAKLYKDGTFRLPLEVSGGSIDKIVKIGRHPDNQIIIEDLSVSGRHAQLELRKTQTGELEVAISDIGSKNGTLFESTGARLTKNEWYVIPPGESVLLGKKTTLYNAMKDVQPGDQIFLRRGPEPGEWLIQASSRSAATPAQPAPAENRTDWLSRFPKRDITTVPEEYRHLIPDLRKLEKMVMFPRFRRIANEMASMVASRERIGVRFFGPPGTGKTTIPEIIAAQGGVPLLRFTFSPRTDPSDVEGMWAYELVPVIGSDGNPEIGTDGNPRRTFQPVYKEGVATVSMEHGFHLVWDEPDLARPGVLAFLNNVSAPGEYAWVRKGDGNLHQIRVHPMYRCHVTENGVREIARQEHGEDFLRRFVPYYVGPWTVEETTRVLRELYEVQKGRRNWSHRVTEVLARVHDRISFLASSFEDPVTHVPMIPLGSGVQQTVQFTPRSLLRLCERLIRSRPMTPETLSRAIRSEYILPLADPQDRAMVWQQIRPILEPLVQEMGWAADAVGPQAIPVPTLREIEEKYLGGKRVPQDGFVWTDQALRVVDETLRNRQLGIDVIWLGDAGIGKTRTPEQISKVLAANHFKGEMSSETDEGDLVGRNGRNGFQPGIVALGVEEGGTVHLDEFLLLSPGRFESVFGPLMDDDQALFIKNPYRRIDRRPGKTFFLFTSNPPWGNFAGKDRYEQSGAAMSRMAVICLTGDFGMQEEDRLAIRMHRPPPPEVRVPIKKKALTPPPEPAGGVSPVLRMADSSAPSGNELPQMEVHPDFRNDYGLPASLAIDLENGKILEPDGSGAFREVSEKTREGLDRLADYLKKRTQFEMAPVVRRVVDMQFRFFGDQKADLATKRVFFNVIDLLRFSMPGALGVGKHEWAHQILDELHPKYFSHEPGRLLFNFMADPRMQEFVAWLNEGLFKAQAEAVNETQWPVVWDEEKQKKWLQATLPHEQFVHAVIHFWRTGEIMPWIEDDKVREALEEAKPRLTAAAHALPKSLSDEDVEKARAEFVRQVDSVWPIYERLFPEGIKKIMERLENGEGPEEIINEVIQNILNHLLQGTPQPSKTKPGIGAREGMSLPSGGLEDLAKKIFDARAGILADQYEPKDPEEFAKKKAEIQELKDAASPSSPLPTTPSHPPGGPDPRAGLAPGELRKIEAKLRQVDRQQLEGNLYRELIAKVPGAARLLARVKKVLPPARPTDLEGYFHEGRRPDPEKMVQDDLSPMPDGRVMLRSAIPSEVEGQIVAVTDVSASMVLSGADRSALIASAVSIYLSEGLNLNYGELLFGSRVEPAKILGKRLGTYPLKNEMLNKKKQAFSDPSINGSTDIRSALAQAITWIKKKRSKADQIVLMTDGGENITHYPKTLEELEAECERAGIELMILAMGDARSFIPLHFKPEHYRFVADDGSDIPDIFVELFEKAHRRRLPGR